MARGCNTRNWPFRFDFNSKTVFLINKTWTNVITISTDIEIDTLDCLSSSLKSMDVLLYIVVSNILYLHYQCFSATINIRKILTFIFP